MKRRKWLAANPDIVAAYHAKSRDKYKYLDARKRFKKYGITEEQYSEMQHSQDGKCAICAKPPRGKGFQIDHSHRTGKTRGLLCVTCNMKLHAIETEWFIRALNYLGRFQ